MSDAFADAAVYAVGPTSFRVLSDNGALLELIDDLWRHCRSTVPAEHTLELLTAADGYVVGVDGLMTTSAVDDATILSRMVWEVNNLVRNAPSASLMIHGAAIGVGAAGVLICGASGAGKSTFAAALCERGATYLSDEIAMLRTDVDVVDSYPKPISLRPDSWPLMTDLVASCPADVAHFMQDTWFVVPSLSQPAISITHLVFVAVGGDAGTTIAAIDPSTALLLLMEQTNAAATLGEPAFRRLAELARNAAAVRIAVGTDLDCACTALTDTLAR